MEVSQGKGGLKKIARSIESWQEQLAGGKGQTGCGGRKKTSSNEKEERWKEQFAAKSEGAGPRKKGSWCGNYQRLLNWFGGSGRGDGTTEK